jgi:hypothetical protein
MNNASNRLQIITIIIALITGSACTNIRGIEPDTNERYSYNIEAGDKLRVTYLDETVVESTVTAVLEDGFRGTLKDRSPVEIAWADVYRVERVTFAPLKTVGATLGVIVAIPVIAAGALVYACAQSGCQ